MQLTITNNATEQLTGVAVNDPFPPGLQVAPSPMATTVGCGTPTFVPTAGATMLAFAAGAIDLGDTCIITVAVTSTTVGAAVNTTDPVMYNGGTGGTATATLTVTPVADLAITKTDNLTAVAPGATIGYGIVVTNGGPTAVTGASVTDTFPGTFTNVTWSAGPPAAHRATPPRGRATLTRR